MMRETHIFFSLFEFTSSIYFFMLNLFYIRAIPQVPSRNVKVISYLFFFLGKTHFSVFMEINPLYIMR